jgi:hypothetical protein
MMIFKKPSWNFCFRIFAFPKASPGKSGRSQGGSFRKKVDKGGRKGGQEGKREGGRERED